MRTPDARRRGHLSIMAFQDLGDQARHPQLLIIAQPRAAPSEVRGRVDA
jgi:hypothetical protein